MKLSKEHQDAVLANLDLLEIVPFKLGIEMTDDVRSLAHIALCHAALKNPRNVRAYGFRAIRSRLWEEFRAKKSRLEREQNYAAVERPQTNHPALYQALDELTPLERDIVSRRFGLAGAQHTERQIAGSLGLSIVEVGRVIESALSRLGELIAIDIP